MWLPGTRCVSEMPVALRRQSQEGEVLALPILMKSKLHGGDALCMNKNEASVGYDLKIPKRLCFDFLLAL